MPRWGFRRVVGLGFVFSTVVLGADETVLRRARVLIDSAKGIEDHRAAIATLQKNLLSQDALFYLDEKHTPLSTWVQAHKVLARIPAKAREILIQGDALNAQALLERATAEPSGKRLMEVVLLYPHTPQAALAIGVLGKRAQDAGRFDEASGLYQWLLLRPDFPEGIPDWVLAQAALTYRVLEDSKLEEKFRGSLSKPTLTVAGSSQSIDVVLGLAPALRKSRVEKKEQALGWARGLASQSDDDRRWAAFVGGPTLDHWLPDTERVARENGNWERFPYSVLQELEMPSQSRFCFDVAAFPAPTLDTDGQHLLFFDSSGFVRVSTQSGKEVSRIAVKPHFGIAQLSGVATLSRSGLIAYQPRVGADRVLEIWSLPEEKKRSQVILPEHSFLRELQFSDDGKTAGYLLFSGDRDIDAEYQWVFAKPDTLEAICKKDLPEMPLASWLSPKGNLAFLADLKEQTWAYHTDCGQPEAVVDRSAHSISLSPVDGRFFVDIVPGRGKQGGFGTWDSLTGKWDEIFPRSTEIVRASWDTRWMLTLDRGPSRTRQIRLQHREDSKRQYVIDTGKMDIDRLEVSPDGRTLLTAGMHEACLWDLKFPPSKEE